MNYYSPYRIPQDQGVYCTPDGTCFEVGQGAGASPPTTSQPPASIPIPLGPGPGQMGVPPYIPGPGQIGGPSIPGPGQMGGPPYIPGPGQMGGPGPGQIFSDPDDSVDPPVPVGGSYYPGWGDGLYPSPGQGVPSIPGPGQMGGPGPGQIFSDLDDSVDPPVPVGGSYYPGWGDGLYPSPGQGVPYIPGRPPYIPGPGQMGVPYIPGPGTVGPHGIYGETGAQMDPTLVPGGVHIPSGPFAPGPMGLPYIPGPGTVGPHGIYGETGAQMDPTLVPGGGHIGSPGYYPGHMPPGFGYYPRGRQMVWPDYYHGGTRHWSPLA